MQKLQSLQTAIFAALPELNKDPDRIRIWIERGSAASMQTASRSLTFKFQANILIVEMASDISVLFLAVFEWARVNQPELMIPGTDGIEFDADVLDKGTADILLQLQLDQAVETTPNESGGYAIQYRAEPDPFDDDIMSIIAPDAAPPLTGFSVDDGGPPWEH